MIHKHDAATRKRISEGVKAAWVKRPRKDMEPRFWEKVDQSPENGCWLWVGAIDKNGYRQMRVTPNTLKAHRIAYELLVGPIPDGLILLHSCDSRRCVNPAHLSVGTYKDNYDDMMRKGRNPNNVRRETCSKGHPHIPENRYYLRGKSWCKICRHQYITEYNARQRMIRGRS